MNALTGGLLASEPIPESVSSSLSTTTSKKPVSNEQLATAGKEFESVFLSMMLKTMRSTISEDGMFAGDKSDTFGGMFDMFMSQHLAASDSLGIGKMIESFMANNGSDAEPGVDFDKKQL